MINRLLNLISRSRSEAKVSMVSSSSDQPPSSNGNLFFSSKYGQIGPKRCKTVTVSQRGGDQANRQGTFQNGASPS